MVRGAVRKVKLDYVGFLRYLSHRNFSSRLHHEVATNKRDNVTIVYVYTKDDIELVLKIRGVNGDKPMITIKKDGVLVRSTSSYTFAVDWLIGDLTSEGRQNC